MVRRGTTSFGMAQFGEVWLGGYGLLCSGALRQVMAVMARHGSVG